MVKGTSRQVIVVQGTEPKLFEQAIFILKEEAKGISDEQLMKQAQQAIRSPERPGKRRHLTLYGAFWAAAGAAATALIWLVTVLV